MGENISKNKYLPLIIQYLSNVFLVYLSDHVTYAIFVFIHTLVIWINFLIAIRCLLEE